MEALAVIGVVASFSQLLNSTIIITEFYQALDDAPSELRRLKTKVLLVRDSLMTLRNLSGDLGQENLITSDLQDLLRTAIDTVAAAVVRSQQACRYAGDKNRARRLRWALIERHRMEELSKALSKAGEGLNLVLEILNIRLAMLSHIPLKEILSSNELIMGKLSPSSQSTNPSDPPVIAQALQCPKRDALIQKSAHDSYEPFVITQGSWLQRLGFFGSIGFRAAGKTRTASTQVGFRFPSWLVHKAVTVEMISHHLVSCWTDVSFSSGRIRLRNVVPTDSPLMSACYHGNLNAVRRCLEMGKGSVNDIDNEGTTLLMRAMDGLREGGGNLTACLEVIQYLVFAGADLNGANNEQWSNLHMAFRHGLIEVARLLICRGADIERVGSAGETLPMVLLHKQGADTEYYTLLSAESFNDFDASCSDGYSALHYAALSGTPEDVAMLRRLTGPIMPTTGSNRTPLHSAATYGNVSATEELCKYHMNTIGGVDIRDTVGRTPLHRALRFSNEAHRLKSFVQADWTRCKDNPRVFKYQKTFEALIRAGADPAGIVQWCKNHPTGCSCSAAKERISTYEYAYKYGTETLRLLLAALEACGVDVPMEYKAVVESRVVEIDTEDVEEEQLIGDQDIFEDAVEFQS